MNRALLILSVVMAAPLTAQRSPAHDSSSAEVRTDGNGIPALQKTLGMGFARIPAASALRAVADAARLNLTYDAHLRGLQTEVDIPAHDRNAATALIEIVAEVHLIARVLPGAQIVVTDSAGAFLLARRTDAAVRIAGIETRATRVEREAFENDANLGAMVFSRDALRATPSFVEPDVLRAAQLLPGIEARSDYSAGFNVRGGENDQNLILLDGYPILNPYHLGGLFSTFIDPIVGRIDLRRGGLPARFGGRLSGVLDVRSAEPANTQLRGSADVSLMSTDASVGSAFRDGKGAWIIAARRTYADAIANLFKPDAFPYHFRDVQAHVTRDLGGGFTASLTGYDGIDIAKGDKSSASAHWGNGVYGATLAKRLGALGILDSARLEQRASASRFDSDIAIPNELFTASDFVRDRRLSGSATFFTRALTHTFGYETSAQRLSYHALGIYSGWSDFIPFDSVRQQSHSGSLFFDETWHVSPTLVVEGGARRDEVREAKWSGWAPRFAAKFLLDENTAITAGLGQYAQWMHSMGREEEPVQPLQFWVASDSATSVSQSRDVTLGVEHWLSPLRIVHVEAFHKQYENVLVPNPLNDPGVAGDEFSRVRGFSYGADVMVRQLDGGRFGGWIAYTYLFDSRTDATGFRYAPPQDRRHNLNVVGSWRVGGNTYGAHVALASGTPVTPVLGVFVRERYNAFQQRWVPDPLSLNGEYIPGTPYSARLPWYKRADVSVRRPIHMRGVPLESYISILNVLNFHNPAAYIYRFDDKAERLSFPNLPLTPTFGFSYAF